MNFVFGIVCVCVIYARFTSFWFQLDVAEIECECVYHTNCDTIHTAYTHALAHTTHVNDVNAQTRYRAAIDNKKRNWVNLEWHL